MTAPNSKPPAKLARHVAALRKFAASFPETREDFPWGHSAFKVKGKTFLFLYADAEQLSLSTKLPASGEMALALDFAEPTGYGLGKSGWVSARFAPRDDVPVDLMKEWIDESYRAIAPRKVVAALESGGGRAPAKGPATARSRAVSKKAKPKRAARTKPRR